jgi:hypothetical protein
MDGECYGIDAMREVVASFMEALRARGRGCAIESADNFDGEKTLDFGGCPVAHGPDQLVPRKSVK